MNDVIRNIVMGITFVISVILVIVGQRYIGYAGLSVQLLGVAGLIVLLHIYNRKYK